MNGNQKFHKATGPAFNVGEVWLASDGSKHSVKIVSVVKYPHATENRNADYAVTYEWMENGEPRQHTKDAWNFQVRYYHQADRYL